MEERLERTIWELLALAGLVLALASPVGAQSQTEPSGYRARAGSAPLEDIRGSGLLLPISEDKSGVTVPFGFDFPFFGTATTQAGVTSEGYLLFGSAVGNVPGALPSTTPPNGVIAPLWGDFDVRLNPAATIHVQTLGTFPQRRFVAQWSNLAFVDLAVFVALKPE